MHPKSATRLAITMVVIFAVATLVNAGESWNIVGAMDGYAADNLERAAYWDQSDHADAKTYAASNRRWAAEVPARTERITIRALFRAARGLTLSVGLLVFLLPLARMQRSGGER